MAGPHQPTGCPHSDLPIMYVSTAIIQCCKNKKIQNKSQYFWEKKPEDNCICCHKITLCKVGKFAPLELRENFIRKFYFLLMIFENSTFY